MFAHVTAIQADPQRIDDLIRIFQDSASDVRSQPGFEEALLLLDRPSGRGMNIALWDSEETLNNGVGTAQQIAQRAAETLQGAARGTNYEVLQHRPGEGKSVARVSRGSVTPGWFYNTETQADMSIIEAASKQPGYRGFLVLGDRGNKHVLGMSFWDSMEHLRRSEGTSGYYHQEMERARDQWEGGWTRDVFDVAFELSCL